MGLVYNTGLSLHTAVTRYVVENRKQHWCLLHQRACISPVILRRLLTVGEKLSVCREFVSTRKCHPEDRQAEKEHFLRMTSTLVVCEVDESLKTKLEKFRFRKETTNAAILMKIDMEKHLVILDKECEDISPDDLREELPERQPRFIVYSYKYVHDDGRVSYPLCFIFSSPAGCKPDQQMMYAGSKNELVKTVGLTKVFETRSVDEVTEEWLKQHLSFFR
ncbi:glia maturation factor gamma [Epinephelus lanceolatus]|uniref:glia maturation factor gamma n=1 Tax=Epinephelus lanceolatus TaxID=310571 RepID=UPI0014457DB4|nr:glia maturation factor gamma [Epinephelus lanceolatus]